MPKGSSNNQKKKNKERISIEGDSTEESNLSQINIESNDSLSSSPERDSESIAEDDQNHLFEPFEIDIIKGGKTLSKKDSEKQVKVTPIDHRSELDLLMEDVRGSIKEESLIDSASQVLPGSVYKKKKTSPKFLQKIDDWVSRNLRDPYPTFGKRKAKSPLAIIIWSAIIIVVLYSIFVLVRPRIQTTPEVVSTITPVPTFVIPKPYSIEFPGGWVFLLGESNDVYPDWKPTQPEWLKGTEICKLIAIPWNIQVDAVYKTIVKGDTIKLSLDNKDQYPYKVLSTSLVSKDYILEMINSNSPCMIIFLYKGNSTSWQVLSTQPVAP